MVLAATAGLASCAQGPQANLKTDVDTLSYMVGAANSQGLMEFVLDPQRMGIDSANVEDFFKGLEQGCKETDAKQKAYLAGLQIGQQISDDKMLERTNRMLFGQDTTVAVDKGNFLAGFLAAAKGKALASADSANIYVRQKSEEIREKALEAQYGDYKKQNEDFLAANKSKDGVQVTESGLQYKVLKGAEGPKPKATDTVHVHYHGTLLNGHVFDSSVQRGEPISFPLNQVIAGWTEGLQMMSVGSKYRFFIPSDLAYGDQAVGSIPAGSTLVFEVELLGINK